jgi:putative sterol carrier protein
MATVKETFDNMQSKFQPAKAAGVNATIQYDITGDQGGTWHAVIKDGACAVNPGAGANPNLTLTMSSQDWLDMVDTKKLSGQMAFMSGKLKIKGDMGLAMKVGSLFAV